MKISNDLLKNEDFRQNIQANFASIEQNSEKGTLWGCGMTSKGIIIVCNDDGIIAKIVFLAKQLFGLIDTSYASMQDLKKRVQVVEQTAVADSIAKTHQQLQTLKQQKTDAVEDLRTTTDQVKSVKGELSTLNTSFDAKKDQIAKLEEEITAKKKDLEAHEEKLKAIAKDAELEAKLQTRRAACQAIAKEIEDITTGLGVKHAELIKRIGKAELGTAGWLNTANQMIKEKESALDKHLSQSERRTGVYDQFHQELLRLRNQIPLINNTKKYMDFLVQLQLIEKDGWTRGNYTVSPKEQGDLQKVILREIKALTELTFTRNQMMALTS